MKTLLFAPAIALLFITGMSSCSKCQVCTKPSESEIRICKGDYSSETEYGFVIDVKEAQGYSCKASI